MAGIFVRCRRLLCCCCPRRCGGREKEYGLFRLLILLMLHFSFLPFAHSISQHFYKCLTICLHWILFCVSKGRFNYVWVHWTSMDKYNYHPLCGVGWISHESGLWE